MHATSLNALHTFESAARNKSYSLAAAELHVTHSAVSQQIRVLEGAMGIRLFERHGRQMLLTPEGTLLHQRIQPALKQISRAVSEVRALHRAPAVAVTTLQSFATFWLLPRLGKFQARHPEVAVHIQASLDLEDLEHSDADIALRYGLGEWKGCHTEKLFDDRIFPVCSPDFNQGRLPTTMSGLTHCRILRDECQLEWDTWSAQAGIDSTQFKHESSYSDTTLMMAATLAGAGIAMGRSSLVEADLAAGRLVRLFDLIVPSPYAYYMVTATSRAKNPPLQAFEQWLRLEAAAFDCEEQGRWRK